MQDNREVQEREERVDRVHFTLQDDHIVGEMLSLLEVNEDEEDPFLRAFLAIFYEETLAQQEYFLLKKYLGDQQFIRKFSQSSIQSRKRLIDTGHTIEEIDIIGQDIQTSIEVMLEKFRVFDVLENPNLLGEKYLVYTETPLGDILLSREENEMYLMRVGTIFAVEDYLFDESGALLCMVFNLGESVIIYHSQTNRIVEIPGVYATLQKKPGIHAIITLTPTEELCYIPETQNFVRKKREFGEQDALFCTFQDIHLIGPHRDEICLQHLGFSVDTREDEVSGDIKVSGKFIEKLTRLENGEILFSDAGTIIDVITTKEDTYIIVEKVLSTLSFDVDEISADFFQGIFHNKQDFSEKITCVYSVEEGYYLPAIPSGSKYRLLPTDDNLIILSLDKCYEYLYSCKDDMGFPKIKIDAVQEFYVDGAKHVIIDYTDQFGVEVSYDSTSDIERHTNEKGGEEIVSRKDTQ